MTRKLLFSIIALFGFVILVSASFDDNGRAGYTGAPAEGNCTSCHNSFAVNSGGGSVALRSNMNNWQYVPGQTYAMSVKVARSSNQLFGVGVGALNASNQNAGTLVITDAVHTQIKTRTVSGVSRRNVVHTLNGGVSSDSALFNFNWTAPPAADGTITFYFAGNAANGNAGVSGDYIYVSSQTISPMSTTGIAENTNQQFQVFPNPTTDRVSVKTFGDAKEICIYSLNGQKVRSQTLTASVNSTINLEQLDQLERGIYYLQVRGEQTSSTQKIILQ